MTFAPTPTIDDYLDALGLALDHAGDIVPWPLHVGQVGRYCGDIEARDLYTRLRARASAGASDREIGEFFVSASSGMSLLMDVITGLKDAEVPAADRVWFVERILAGLAAVQAGDVLCRDGAHRLLSPDEVNAAVESGGWSGRDEWGDGFARSAFALSGAAQALVWSQHFYGWTDIGFVIHGPYELPDGQLVVRDFFDLRPVPVWPHTAAVPIGSLRVFSRHDATDKYTVDLFNHLLHTHPQLDSCVALRVEVDGTPLTSRAVADRLRAGLVEQIRRQHAVLAGLDTHGMLTKFVESRYYALRRWREPRDWRPEPEVYGRIRTQALEPPPPAADWTTLRRVFDPRLDWGD